jgi:hypothetical protein
MMSVNNETQDFDAEIKAWGDKNTWFTNPQTDLELEMYKDAVFLHGVVSKKLGKPANSKAVDEYLSFIDKEMREAYPEYQWRS